MWIGLSSPDAPANSASVRRVIGSIASGGITPSSMPDHQYAAQFGHRPAGGVCYRGLFDDELERASLFVIDIGDPRAKRENVARAHRRVILEVLFAVQQPAQ